MAGIPIIPMTLLAREVLEISSSRSNLIFLPLPKDDPKKREPDISKAKSLLNWEPKIDRKEGVFKTIKYFKNTRRLHDARN